VVGLDEVRAFALALPEVEEGPSLPAARRMAAFKVHGKSFLGIGNGGQWMTASLSAADVHAFISGRPEAFQEIRRSGRGLMGLRVDLSTTSPLEAREVIERSWRHCAPQRLLAAGDAPRDTVAGGATEAPGGENGAPLLG